MASSIETAHRIWNRAAEHARTAHGFDCILSKAGICNYLKELPTGGRLLLDARIEAIGYSVHIFPGVSLFDDDLVLIARCDERRSKKFIRARFPLIGNILPLPGSSDDQFRFSVFNPFSRPGLETRMAHAIDEAVALFVSCASSRNTFLRSLEDDTLGSRICIDYSQRVRALAACLISASRSGQDVQDMFDWWKRKFDDEAAVALRNWLKQFEEVVMRRYFKD